MSLTTTENCNNENNAINSTTSNKKNEQWLIDTIGNFLVELYHKRLITLQGNWEIEKNVLRKQFSDMVLAPPHGNELLSKFQEITGIENANTMVGTLLYRTNFLLNTPRGSQYFRIKCNKFFEYRNKKRAEYDERQKNGEFKCNPNDIIEYTGGTADSDNLTVSSILKEPTVAENSEILHLEYLKSQEQVVKHKFQLSSMGCFICQENFDDIEKYEEHIEYHNDESNFKSLENMKKCSQPMLNLSYQLCEKSHYFCFTLSTDIKDIIIEKMIIVQSRTFYYVNNGRMPYKMPENGIYRFFIDSHMFTIYQEQPIVVIFKKSDIKSEIRYVEQHHFMRTEAFPIVHLAIKPYRLSSASTFKGKHTLEAYSPPLQDLKKDIPDAEIDSLSSKFLNLNSSNITDIMTKILNVEDIEILKTYKCLKQTNVELHQFAKELSLQLNIGANVQLENILSPYDDVLVFMNKTVDNDGDNNILTDSGLIMDSREDIMRKLKKKGKTMYFGRVECISNRRVTFTCDKKIPDGKSYTVIFRPSRLVLRYQYRALRCLKTVGRDVIDRLLFPEFNSVIDLSMNSLVSGLYGLNLKDIDRRIFDNPEQLQAIRYITESNKLPAPYIVFGPPGTGKTATIVEAILQLYERRPNTRILIMAGSNSACDEIALRLLRRLQPLNDRNIITRIYSRSNDKRIDNIDELLLDFSNMYSTHFYPDIQTLHEYRIVICTLSVVGKLGLGHFGKGQNNLSVFTHVFVDEVAASTEPEVIMGIACAMSPEVCLILSGDHKQLGPVLQSKRAEDLGLGVSLMERLLKRDCYKVDEEGNYNHKIQTRLRRNYRSHPEIVELYSKMYYNSELIAMAPKDRVNLCEKWHLSPNTDFPILFHCVFGKSHSSKMSSSLSNQSEIEVVMDYVKDLMYFGINGEKLKQEDIGIISPYKRQYICIQEQLTLRNWYQIECGSVETFQGKEKAIIIVSFVRSFTSTLGFLDDPRRLNVTLSRPKSLLILIGNPRTLSLNEQYGKVIELCKTHNTLVGSTKYKDENFIKDKRNDNTNVNPAKKRYNNKQKKNTNNIGGPVKNIRNDNDTMTGNKLGKQMKKSTLTVSQQKQRQLFETYKNLLEKNETETNNINTTSKLDDFFNDLPPVPRSNESNIKSTNTTTNNLPKSTLLLPESHRIVRVEQPTNTRPTQIVKTPPATAPRSSTGPVKQIPTTLNDLQRRPANLQGTRSSSIFVSTSNSYNRPLNTSSEYFNQNTLNNNARPTQHYVTINPVSPTRSATAPTSTFLTSFTDNQTDSGFMKREIHTTKPNCIIL